MHSLMLQLRTIAAHLTARFRQAFSLESGASSVEYSFLVAFIATIIITVVGQIGLQLVPGFQTVEGGF